MQEQIGGCSGAGGRTSGTPAYIFVISTTPNFGFGDFRAFYGVLPVRNGDKIGLFYVLFNFAIGMKTSTSILGSRPPIMVMVQFYT